MIFLPNQLFLQTLPSLLVSHILDPQPGETVLDMCAAPGGKTSHIGILMKNKGVIIATEKKKNKLQQILKTLSSQQVTCAQVYIWDATKLLFDHSKNSKHKNTKKLQISTKFTPTTTTTTTTTPTTTTTTTTTPTTNTLTTTISTPTTSSSTPVKSSDLHSPPYSTQYFDRILLDPPCSGLGNRPRFIDKTNLSSFMGFPDYQKKLVDVAVALLKPGGTLVYSTCTISPYENEEMVHYLLSKYSDSMSLVPPPPEFHIGQPGLPGTSLSQQQQLQVQRFDPTAKENTIG